MKESIIAATEECLPKKQKTKRKEWMTEDILKKMEERKKWKNDGGRYKMLDQEVHKMCDKAKE